MKKNGLFKLVVASLLSSMLCSTPIMAMEDTYTSVLSEGTAAAFGADNLSEVYAVGFSQEEWEVLYLTNYIRKINGIEPMSVYKELQDASNIRKNEIVTSFSHTRPNGMDGLTALDDAGVVYKIAAENLAISKKTPQDVIDAWWYSDSHRSNMLNSFYSHMSAGYTTRTGGHGRYWVQMFTGRCTPDSISIVQNMDSVLALTTEQNIDHAGLVLRVSCEHGISYLPLMDEMCNYDATLLNQVQTLTVSYREQETSFKICMVEPLPFIDVSSTDWFYVHVADAYYNKLMAGTTKTTFSPLQSVTRAQFATVLYRMAGSPEVEYRDVFADVPDNTWYTNAVLWANAEGVVYGYSSENYAPDDKISREQMAAMLYRFANYLGLDTSKRGNISGYKDAIYISSYANDAIQWAVGESIVNGRTSQILEPRGIASRAECATIIMQFVNRY